MTTFINFQSLTNSIVYSIVGFVMLGLGFYLFDKLTPWQLWKEIIDEQNVALGIVSGAIALGISIIIASAITG